MKSLPRYNMICSIVVLTLICASLAAIGDEPKSVQNRVDAKSLRHKVMCGYQGWFRCLGDGTNDGWTHWSRNKARVTPDSITFEMWPDTSELSDDEKFNVPGFSHRDGSTAFLFSSAHPKTVERHFRWMEKYGIDGVFVQRFLVGLRTPSVDDVLEHVRSSAAKTGRVFAVCYDLTGEPSEKIYDLLVQDWKRLVDEKKVTQDNCYLHHNGKPVLVVWGFFSDRFGPDLAHRIIDFFKSDDHYGVTLALRGVPAALISRLMGHADPRTTAIYTTVAATQLIAALDDAGLL